MRIRQTTHPLQVSTIAPLALAVAVALGIAALVAWGRSMPALGERPFSVHRIWAARCLAVGLSAAAQAALFGIALPVIYRQRPIYLGIAALALLTAAGGAIGAASLAVIGR